jgi:uncharacterized membrane protein (DUF485 family)
MLVGEINPTITAKPVIYFIILVLIGFKVTPNNVKALGQLSSFTGSGINFAVLQFIMTHEKNHQPSVS